VSCRIISRNLCYHSELFRLISMIYQTTNPQLKKSSEPLPEFWMCGRFLGRAALTDREVRT
jgi:hypothetical protein